MRAPHDIFGAVDAAGVCLREGHSPGAVTETTGGVTRAYRDPDYMYIARKMRDRSRVHSYEPLASFINDACTSEAPKGRHHLRQPPQLRKHVRAPPRPSAGRAHPYPRRALRQQRLRVVENQKELALGDSVEEKSLHR